MTDPVVIFKTHENAARPSPELAAPVPPDRPRRRKALGLAPASDDLATRPAFVSGLPSIAPSFGAETLARAATMGDVAEALDCAAAINLDLAGDFKAKIARLEIENARDKATIAALRSKLAEIDFIVERLKIENKGPPGVKGERG